MTKTSEARRERLLRFIEYVRQYIRTFELPGKNPLKDAHANLDAAVLTAYGFSAKKDLLTQLLDLNLQVAQRIENNHPVTAPGLPAWINSPMEFITDDCVAAR